MKKFGVKFRVVLGMVGLTVSLVFLATYLNIVPDRVGAVREGRSSLAESLAVHCTAMMLKKDTRRLEADLKMVAERNDDLLSFALRRGDGYALIVSEDHDAMWQPMAGEFSKEEQVRIPINSGNLKWGNWSSASGR